MKMMNKKIYDIVTRADLNYKGVTKRSEEGLPIGNGMMGSTIWTSPTALKMQVNRNDVYANDSYSNSFNERDLDYGYGCGFVDIDFADYSEDVFDEDTKQHLFLYEAEGCIEGKGVLSKFFACEGTNTFAFDIKDTRKEADGINVKVKMLRPAEVRTKNHMAISCFEIVDDVVVLVQEYSEGDYYCSSALAVKVTGKNSRIRYNNESGGRSAAIPGRSPILLGQENETEMRICLEPGKGSVEVFVSTAATFDKNVNLVKKAVSDVNKASKKGYKALKEEQAKVWASYWETSYIELWGTTEAEIMETYCTYFSYIIGCCSRNSKYAPNFGGLLFSTRGDYRHWGVMEWWNNLSLYYNPVLDTGRFELDKPFFQHWTNMLERLRVAAKQQWGCEGIFIPEVVGFDGPEILPDDIATEMQELFLQRKPWNERSDRYRKFEYVKRPHEARWNNKLRHESWVDGYLAYGPNDTPFGPTTHMFGAGPCVAYEFYRYYLYTGDKDYLQEYGYPIIKGVAEFYMSLPFFKRGADGKIHTHKTNSCEGYYNCTDSFEVLTSARLILSILIKSSEILDIDEVFRNKCSEWLRDLAPIPTSDDPRIEYPKPDWDGPIFSMAACDFDGYHHSPYNFSSLIFTLYDYCALETKYVDPELFEVAYSTMGWGLKCHPLNTHKTIYEMSRLGGALAAMGMGDVMVEVLMNQINCVTSYDTFGFHRDNGRCGEFKNRLTANEGVNAISAQRLGNVTNSINKALLQSFGGSIEADPVLHLFPALPTDWNANFMLYAAGGFRVEATCENDEVKNVLITSLLGNTLRVRNTWTTQIKATNKQQVIIANPGDMLVMDTAQNDMITLTCC